MTQLIMPHFFVSDFLTELIDVATEYAGKMTVPPCTEGRRHDLYIHYGDRNPHKVATIEVIVSTVRV